MSNSTRAASGIENQTTRETRINDIKSKIEIAIDAASETGDDNKLLVDSIMCIVLESIVKASAFDSLDQRLKNLYEYLAEKEESSHRFRDHATAYRYNIEKNTVENIQLIYTELKG